MNMEDFFKLSVPVSASSMDGEIFYKRINYKMG